MNLLRNMYKAVSTHRILLLIIVAGFPLISLLHPGLPITHDGQDHVARIANFYQSLREGNIVPRWAGNLNWGYGHPILMFLYPLPSYIASLGKFIGFSFVDSTKLVFAVAYIASVFGMYLWISAQWGKTAGLLSAVLYGYSPYRFVDLYVRGAIGEHVAFAVIPFTFLMIFRVFKEYEKNRTYGFFPLTSIIMLSVVLALLILSHNAISIMVLPVICMYVVCLFIRLDRKPGIRFLFSIALGLAGGFALSAFFWIPAYFEGKYTLRDIVIKGEALKRFVPWHAFVYSPWNYGTGEEITKELGIFPWISIAVLVYDYMRIKRKEYMWFYSVCILTIVISIVLMTSVSSYIWTKLSFLQTFQFPWRFLTLTTLGVAAGGGVAAGRLLDTVKKNEFKSGILIIIVLFSFVSTWYMWHPKSYEFKPESFYSGIYDGTTDTGESSPIWSVRFMEHRPSAPIEIIQGNANVIPIYRTTTTRRYTVQAESSVRLVENTLYFPGWNIYVDGANIDIQYQDPSYRGLMTFSVPKGAHTINILFKNTKVRTYANIISLVCICIAVIAYILYRVISIYDKKQ